jgi:hypothetical protein
MINPWTEYERRKAALPHMTPREYEAAILAICEELGI